MQHSTERRKLSLQLLQFPPAPSQPQAPPPPTPTTTINDAHFTILQWNVNGIGNKIDELGIFMEKHKVKVAVIQESKLSQTSSAPCIQNYTTVRKDRRLGQGGGLLTFVHKSISYLRKPESPETLGDPHLEELSISAKLGNTDLIISNIYISPTSSCTGGYQPSLDHLMMTTDTLLLGDFNAHHSSWHSSSTDTRSTNLENTINGTNFGILNWGTPTRLPGNATPSSPDVSLLYRKNLFMKEKLNKKEQHTLYTLFTIYRSNIVGKTNQFKHNSLFINLFCLQDHLSQWLISISFSYHLH